MPRGGRRTRSGPAPKPTNLKVLHGSAKGKRQAKVEPEAELGPPPKPDWLGPVASEAWDDLVELLVEMRVVTVADRLALEMLATVYEEWRVAAGTVEDEGTTQLVETQFGERIQSHPAVAQRSDAFRRLHAMAQEFGLTPAARSRLQAPPKRKESDPLDDLMNRGGGRRG